MNDRDFIQAVVEYVELTDSLLSKQAAPVLNKEAIEKTAEALVGAKLIRKEESKILTESLQKDPGRALDLLQKVAERYVSETASSTVDTSIGSPVLNGRSSAITSDRESDRFFVERFNKIK